MNKTKKRQLTAKEKQWSENLRRIWHNNRKTLGYTSQEQLSIDLGWSGSVVGQYLRGYIPLNTDAKITFSKALNCKISDIDPEFKITDSPAPRALMPNDTTVLDRLESLLSITGTTRDQLSQKTGIDRAMIDCILLGRIDLPFYVVKKINDLFPQHTYWLTTGLELPESGQISPRTKQIQDCYQTQMKAQP